MNAKNVQLGCLKVLIIILVSILDDTKKEERTTSPITLDSPLRGTRTDQAYEC